MRFHAGFGYVWVTTLPLALLWGCGGDDAPENLPDWSDGYESGEGEAEGEGGNEGTGGTIEIAVDTLPYPARIYELGDINAPCSVVSTANLDERDEIFCQMEVKEADLFQQGLMYDVHISAGACEYFRYKYYQYEAFEVGFGPSQVSYTIDADGNIVNEDGTRNGEPYCEYDYSDLDDDWPNCCLGRYTLTVTDQKPDPDKVTVYPPKSWGGDTRPGDCHDGAAYADDDVKFNEDGWPVGKSVFLDWQSFNKRYELGTLSEDYGTNVPYANYFDPADHQDDGQPAGLRPDAVYAPYPYYTFSCEDDAYEVFASIRLIVREWNEKEEFFKPDNSGDPDTVGFEPGTQYDVNDFQDWKDATPGSSTWIWDFD